MNLCPLSFCQLSVCLPFLLVSLSLSVCLYVCMSVCLPAHLLSICLPTVCNCLLVCLSLCVCVSVCLYVCLSVYLPVCLSVSMFACLSHMPSNSFNFLCVYQSVCRFVFYMFHHIAAICLFVTFSVCECICVNVHVLYA